MRWFSFGQEAEGVIAIGQIATGVIAVGQLATGVIAIGQVARGFVAVGQGAIGVVAVGMGSVGLVYSVGMIGVGGRGLGLVLPLVPSLGPKLDVPALVPARRLLAGDAREGHVAATLERDGDGYFLHADGRALDVRLDVRLRGAVEGERAGLPVHAHLTRTDAGWVCDGLQRTAEPRWKRPGWWAWWAAQLGALAVATVVFWVAAGIPVVQALFNPGGILVAR